MLNFYKSLKGFRFLNSISLFLIQVYQVTLGYFLGGRCRHYPSCSNYAVEAFQNYQFSQAFLFVFRRVLSCHPLSRKPFYDPIPFLALKKRVINE